MRIDQFDLHIRPLKDRLTVLRLDIRDLQNLIPRAEDLTGAGERVRASGVVLYWQRILAKINRRETLGLNHAEVMEGI